MALRHKLALEVPETNNPSIFRVADISEYIETLPVKCPTLEITTPGYKDSWIIEVGVPGFNYVLNACTLGIMEGRCGEHSPSIPDGIYKIKYSVSPNESVYVEYLHLRITQTLNNFNAELCLLDICPDSITYETKKKIEHLNLLKAFIESAKVFVEDCHDAEKGMKLLLYVQKELKKLSSDIC